MTTFKPCPHCGGTPTFTHPEMVDDNRYVEMALHCCTTLRATIAYPVFVPMSEDMRRSVLIEDLAKTWNQREGSDDQLDEALATFLANHTRLNEDGIDQRAMFLALALNYAALKPVPKEDIQEWIDNGYNPQLLQFDRPECDGTDAAHPAFHRGIDYALLLLVGKIEEILDGKDTGTGKANEPWESARQRMIKLVRARREVLALCYGTFGYDATSQEILDQLETKIKIAYGLEG